MTETNVAVRLARNLRYKLTYIRIFEDWLEAEQGPEMSDHLRELVKAQQTAVGSLSSYLRRLDVSVQDLELQDKLLVQASARHDLASRLRFIHEALQGAVSWYRMQFSDKQMTSEPELQQLLLELGEVDAVKLWRTKVIMRTLKIPLKPRDKDWDVDKPLRQPDQLEGWRPRLLDDAGQGGRTAGRPPGWSGAKRSRRRGSRS